MSNKAVIFDMDGVISDTQQFHAGAESQILAEYNINMTPEEITAEFAGVADEKMFEEIFLRNGIKNIIIKDVVFRKWDIMRDMLKGRLTAIPFVTDLIKSLYSHNFKLAVASSSPTTFIDEVIDTLSLRSYFHALVSAQEVKKGKPAPDIFLLAAEKINVPPKNCVVVEDGKSGMIGAQKAGMKVIAYGSETEKYPADLTVTTFKNVSVDIVHLLNS